MAGGGVLRWEREKDGYGEGIIRIMHYIYAYTVKEQT